MPSSIVSSADASALSTRRGSVLSDSFTEAGRHIRIMPRNLEVLLFATIQPIMFILLFSVVFGGSIKVPGYENYDQYLLPGIFAQTVSFGSSFTAVGLAEDLSKGFVDRLRSLPISSAAVLIGRTVADLVRNIITFAVMFAVAFSMGFRIKGSLVDAVLASGLLLLFGFGLSWLQALLGLLVKSVEAANSAGFMFLFPMTFVSSAFISTDTLPAWVAPLANANPFTQVTDASRALYNGNDPGSSIAATLLWSIGMVVVLGPLAVKKYSSS